MILRVTNKRGTLDPRRDRPPFTDWERETMADLEQRVRAEGCDCHVVYSWEDREHRHGLTVREAHDDRCAWQRRQLMAEVMGPMRGIGTPEDD